MNIESVPLAELHEDPHNARKHNPRNIETIIRSLRQFGQQKPIVVDAEGTIVAGNGIYRAATALGWPALQVVRTELAGLDRMAYAIADNRTGDLAGWSDHVLAHQISSLQETGDLLSALNYDDRELEALLSLASADLSELRSSAKPIQFEGRVKCGELWALGKHKVLCGNSTDGPCRDRLFAGAKPKSAIYDPPWDKMQELSLPEHKLVFTNNRRLGESLAMFGIPRWLFVWDCVSVWWTRNQPLWRAKFCLWYGSAPYNEDGAHFGKHDDLKPMLVKGGRGPHIYKPDVRGKRLADIFAKLITAEHRAGSSHAKPLDWMRMLIANCLPPGLLFDPFVGTGTSLLAAEQIGRTCFAMDNSQKAVKTTIERWQELTGCKAELLEPSPEED